MKSMLLAKMAVNAKIAKDDLASAMRKTQKEFADAAALENQRWRKNNKRFKKTRAIMKRNKKQAARDLKAATAAQQRALATLAAQTNAKIKKTNKHIAENSAQIKENAKKAREDLDNAMDAFNNKMANVEEEARKGRSKLAAQAAAQDKKFRTDANNRIKAITAKTSAEFAKVRKTMADDRAHADAQLAHTTSRMNAALSAQTALQDKRFAATVSDIAAAKKEASDRVEGFKTSFNADILQLSGHVEEQTQKLNNEMTELAGTVANNKLDQAKTNNAVSAELKRMVKVGNDRYAEHLKKDEELRDLMTKNKEDTNKQIIDMKDQFFSDMGKIKEQMKKDREHAANALTTATSDLYDTLAKNKEAQDAMNAELTDATRAAELDAAAALKEAKEHFATKISSLDSTVKANAKKHEEKVEELTGIVRENAIKDLNGREQLKKLAEQNNNELKSAVADAIHQGEARALQVEAHVKTMNDKTRDAMNLRITTEIGELRGKIHGQIDELSLETKEARAEMKKEILYSVKTASELAQNNLKNAVTWAEGEFSKLNTELSNEETKSEAARAELEATIAADKQAATDRLNDAVATQAAAVLALTTQTHKEIKDTNENLSAHADQMKADAETVRAQMDANQQSIDASLQAAKEAADAQLAAVSQASVARYAEVIQAVSDGVKGATERANQQFSDAYIKMADDRDAVASALASSVGSLNEKIATAAALEDARFSKTVKNLAAARKEANDAVKHAKSQMTAEIADTIATAKKVQTRITGQVQEVSSMIVSNKAARGVIKKIMNENKLAAHEEVTNLANEATAAIKKTRSLQASLLNGFKTDLTEATEKVYAELANQDVAFQAEQKNLQADLAGAKAQTASALQSAKDNFNGRLTSLVNAVTANQKTFEENLEAATGVVMDWKEAADEDREAIRASRDSIVQDLEKNIDRAISLGEAKAKQVEDRAMGNIDTEKKSLLTAISQSVNNMADQIFTVVQEDRQKIADNYLSLKAYSAAAADQIEDYLAKGKGRNLASIGDLLESVAANVKVDTPAAQGVGAGADHLPTIFSGEDVKIDNSVSKINGLVNEYISTLADVKERWPLGLGKYLLAKLELAMQKTGALEVDKIEAKTGNYVFINAHAVGLSSKLSDFEGLAVKMTLYEQTLASLTGSLPETKTAAKPIQAPPPQWQGD